MSEDAIASGGKLNTEQQQQLLFMMLVQQHEQIGMMGLGKLKDPSSDKISKDLNATRYAIDTLKMLETYTKGNLTNDMKSYLTHVLSTLQLNYVDEAKSEKSTKPEAETAEKVTDSADQDSSAQDSAE